MGMPVETFDRCGVIVDFVVVYVAVCLLCLHSRIACFFSFSFSTTLFPSSARWDLGLSLGAILRQSRVPSSGTFSC